uniref:Uncharacterized protein n=1 Tax=Arundo donax TaxID=35708 RepID=A0A0A9G8G9_ARUDO
MSGSWWHRGRECRSPCSCNWRYRDGLLSCRDDEVVVGRGRAVSLPIPAPLFVEDDIACHVHALVHRIVGSISLDTFVVPDEDHGGAAIIKLVEVRVHVLDVDDATECGQVLDGRLPVVPCLIRRLVAQALRGGAIEEVDGRHDRLPPKLCRQALLLQQRAYCRHHCLVSPFDDTVLLRAVGCHELVLYAMFLVVACEFILSELAAIVGVDDVQPPAALHFCRCLDAPD